jgi:hypothetical protein
MEPAIALEEEVMVIADEPAESAHRRSAGSLVGWTFVGLLIFTFIGAIALGVRAEVLRSRRDQCTANLKRLALAMHGYQGAQNHLPTPAIFDRAGKPLLSWRVELLPYLGYQSLYERFRRDEAWDSPHNRGLLAEMPAEFACPGGPGRQKGLTGYLVIVGPKTDETSVNTAFEATRGIDLREMTDGTSTTILMLETNQQVPWTKPDDLRWAPGSPLPQMASPHDGGAFAAFADGSTRFLKSTIESSTLTGILTINGGEALGG